MKKEEAVNYLIAYAYCGVKGLHCENCPLYNGPGACADWTEDIICDAVETLQEEE